MGRSRARLLREPSRLSVHTEAESGETGRQGEGGSWEQELLQLQIASSALINPLGNTESAAIADPRIIAEVTHQAEQAQAGSPVSVLGKPAHHVEPHGSGQRSSLDLQRPAGEAGNDGAKSHPETVADNVRSIASPFFAIAQQFAAPAAPALEERPQRAPPPLLTALSSPASIGEAGSPVYVGLALQRQTEAAEIIIPQSSFSSLTSSPTLPDHPLAATPLSPQTTAKGFVTADSFKHEPGHTLLDCTDPTPNHSLDLDDPGLKDRLARLLPNVPFPPLRKTVRRNLSSQIFSLERLSEGPDGADEVSGIGQGADQRQRPGPVPGSSGDESASEAKTMKPRVGQAAHRNWRRLSETGALCEQEGSQTGKLDALAEAFSTTCCCKNFPLAYSVCSWSLSTCSQVYEPST